jgi:hypothetical protein
MFLRIFIEVENYSNLNKMYHLVNSELLVDLKKIESPDLVIKLPYF